MRLDTTTDKGLEWAIENDIDTTNPIDLCSRCARQDMIEDISDVAHPPYDDDIYNCSLCGTLLIFQDE